MLCQIFLINLIKWNIISSILVLMYTLCLCFLWCSNMMTKIIQDTRGENRNKKKELRIWNNKTDNKIKSQKNRQLVLSRIWYAGWCFSQAQFHIFVLLFLASTYLTHTCWKRSQGWRWNLSWHCHTSLSWKPLFMGDRVQGQHNKVNHDQRQYSHQNSATSHLHDSDKWERVFFSRRARMNIF